MAVSITIAGVDRTSLIRRESVRASLAGPNVGGTLDCVLDDPNREVTISPRQELLVLDGATRLWGGLIVGVRAEVIAGGMRRYRITARDHGVLLDDQASIEQTFAAGTTERAVVQAIVSGSGLSAPDSTVVVTATLAKALTIKAESRRVALDQLMDAVGGTRYLWVDELAQVHYRSSSLGAAPFVLVDTAPSAGQADYESLSIDTDATAGPSATTRGSVEVVGADGWKPGQTVTISSTALGLSSAQYLIAEVELAFATDAVRRWRLALGAPPKRLSTALGSAPSLPPPTIESIAQFAASIRPPVIVSALPTLPNGAYPAGSLVFLTTDGRLYKTESGTAWEPVVAAVDLDGQITSTQITDGAISTPKLAAGAVTTPKLSAGAVTANELAANSVVAGKIAAGAVATNELAANAVTTAKLAAGAVTADKLSVGGQAGGLITNGDFETGDLTGWTYSGGSNGFAYVETVAAAGNKVGSGSYQAVIRRDGTAGTPRLESTLFPAKGSVLVSVLKGGASGVLQVHWSDANKTYLSSSFVSLDSTNGRVSLRASPPANAQWASVGIGNTDAVGTFLVFDDFRVSVNDGTVMGAGGNVYIDQSGITIENGKLTFADNYGATALDGSGFGDAWQDFIRAGLYNGNFSRVSGGQAAGWTIDNSGTYPLTVVTGTGWGSGNAIQYAPTGASAAPSSMASDYVTVTGRQFIRVSTYWSVIAGVATIETRLYVHWYDAAKTYLSSSVGLWTAVPNNWFIESDVLSPPAAARYFRFALEIRCTAGSGTVQLRSVAASDWQTTTEFIPPGAIVAWTGASPPAGWRVCDGTNGTPDLTDRMIVGGTSTASGGSVSPTVGHTHALGTSGGPSGTVSAVDGAGVSAGSGVHTHALGTSGATSYKYYRLIFIMKT